MINKVILIGNLGKDPEVRHLENGGVVGKFSLATNENYRDKSGEWQTITEWHNIVVWRQLAERAEKSLKKGMQVYIEGKLTTRKWQDQNGADRYSTDIVANTLRILERKDSNDSYSDNDYLSENEVSNKLTTSKEKEVFNIPGSKSNSNDNSGAQDFTDMDDDLPF